MAAPVDTANTGEASARTVQPIGRERVETSQAALWELGLLLFGIIFAAVVYQVIRSLFVGDSRSGGGPVGSNGTLLHTLAKGKSSGSPPPRRQRHTGKANPNQSPRDDRYSGDREPSHTSHETWDSAPRTQGYPPSRTEVGPTVDRQSSRDIPRSGAMAKDEGAGQFRARIESLEARLPTSPGWLEDLASQQDREFSFLKKRTSSLEQELGAIGQIQERLAELEGQTRALQAQRTTDETHLQRRVSQLDETVAGCQARLARKDEDIAELKQQIQTLRQAVQDVSGQLAAKEMAAARQKALAAAEKARAAIAHADMAVPATVPDGVEPLLSALAIASAADLSALSRCALRWREKLASGESSAIMSRLYAQRRLRDLAGDVEGKTARLNSARTLEDMQKLTDSISQAQAEAEDCVAALAMAGEGPQLTETAGMVESIRADLMRELDAVYRDSAGRMGKPPNRQAMRVLGDVMDALGLRIIEVVLGETAEDDRLHERIGTEAREGAVPGVIVDIVGMGYEDKANGRVLRKSQVIVVG
jgi:molecular chaperone GrpE (heat shock protein)